MRKERSAGLTEQYERDLKAREHYGDQLRIALFPELVSALGEVLTIFDVYANKVAGVPFTRNRSVVDARALLARCRDVV